MAGGLAALLDDIATLAKAAAASVDDIGVAAGKASAKAAGVVVDDTAVTPAYVQGLAAERELPIIKRIAAGSLRNKLVFILPAALLLSAVAPALVEVVLMLGGSYLCYEGAHKIHHLLVQRHDDHGDGESIAEALEETFDPDHEERTVAGAIRTDFILSAEIMVIALKDVLDEGFVSRAVILVVVAGAITAVVYGVVALIVKMDDIGLRMAASDGAGAQRIGRTLVTAMPKVLAVLSGVGTAAMLWVGGHILVVGAAELGWQGPKDLVHDLADPVGDVAGIGGVLAWTVDTLASAVVGVLAGFLVLTVVNRVSKRSGPTAAVADAVTH